MKIFCCRDNGEVVKFHFDDSCQIHYRDQGWVMVKRPDGTAVANFNSAYIMCIISDDQTYENA